jgi:2-acylglycerol O-acyltransferase 2
MVKIHEMKKAGENKNEFLALLGFLLVASNFIGWIFFLYLFFTYGLYVKATIILLLIYQLSIHKRSELFFGILEYCHPYNYFKSYTVVFEEDIQESKSLICIHPHGIIGLSLVSFVFSGFSFIKKMKICGSRFVRYLPVSGIVARWIGIDGVNHKNFKNFMEVGKNIIFIPGGFECATVTSDKQDKTFILNRKGFIKYSLRHGYAIHPVYNFGENRLFYTINGYEKLGFFLNKIKFPGCLFFGRFGILPRNDIDLCTVVGKSIKLPVIINPTEAEIDIYHKIYLEELTNLYQRHYKTYGGTERLEFV